MEKIKRLLSVSRPISWPNTAYPFAAGYILSGGNIDFRFIIGTLFFLLPYNLLMYGINDVFDYESDRNNPRKGGIEGALEQKQFHPTIIKAALCTSLPFTIYLLIGGSVISAVTLLVVLFMVIAYSAPYLRFKERPLLDSITSSTHFVGPLVFALSLHQFPSSAWPFVAAFFLWGAASHALGAIQDIIPDRAGNLASVATIFGARVTIWLVAGLYAASIIIMLLQESTSIIIGLAGCLYLLNLVPYLTINDTTSASVNRAWRRFISINYIVGAIVTLCLLLPPYL